MLEEFKQFIKSNESELVLTLGVILISLISFSAGRLTSPGAEKEAVGIEYLTPTSAQPASAGTTAGRSAFKDITNDSTLQELGDRVSGMYVASKNSNKYHLPDCTGANRIAEHNKIWFNSKEEAESLGYTPAANCPGL